AKLEFYDVYRISDAGIYAAFQEADKRLARVSTGESEDETEEVRMDTTYTMVYDSLGQVIDSVENIVESSALDGIGGGGPLTANMNLNFATGEGLSNPPSVMGTASRNRKNIISEMLARPDIKALFPRDLDFKWAYKPSKDIT